jgi:TrmH family RNA methyltransferase
MITSPANERLKQVRRVREGREPGLMFIEGERLIESCLHSPVELVACYHSDEPTERAAAILEELARRECPLLVTAAAVLATLSDTVSPQGMILIARRPHYDAGSDLDRLLGDEGTVPLIVGIDAVQDPGNFGAILRTAEAAGATGVIALRGSVDPFAPKTLRSAMGSAFRLPVVTDLEPAQVRSFAQARGLSIVSTAVESATIYNDLDWRRPSIVFFGNEGNGISAGMLELSDDRVRIPVCAPVESLNVAAAAAVILFEAVRQRRQAGVGAR